MFRRALAAVVRPVPRNRRAALWAGVYCRAFEVDDRTDGGPREVDEPPQAETDGAPGRDATPP